MVLQRMNMIHILHADHEQNNLNAFQAYFRRIVHFEIISCLTADDTIKYLKESIIHIAVIDQVILEKIGFDVLNQKTAFTIGLTASLNLDFIESALNNGKLFKYHSKPFILDDLSKSVMEASNKVIKQ